MTARFAAGLALVVVGIVLLTIVWALSKRDDALYVETDAEDDGLPSNVTVLEQRRAS